MVPSLVMHATAWAATSLAVFLQAEVLDPAALLLLAVVALVLPGRWRILALSIVGAAVLATHAAAARLADRLTAAPSAAVTVAGRVVGLPEPLAYGTRLAFAPDAGSGLPALVQVDWGLDGPAPAAGERWRFDLRLRPVRGLRAPGAADAERAAFVAGVGARATVRGGQRLSAAGGSLLRLRAAIAARIAVACAGLPACGVVQGLAVGHAGAVSDAAWRRYRDTGTVHLIAISGLHVTLFALLVQWVVRLTWARLPRACLSCPATHAAWCAALLAATAYALLAGFGVPARRTLLMLAVAGAVSWRRREPAVAEVLAAAGLAVMLSDPTAILAPGTWLSFGGVAVLVWAARDEGALVTRWWRAQAAASVGLTPLLVLVFGAVPLAGLPANLLAVPVFNLLAVPLAVGGALLCGLWPALADHAFRGAAQVLGWLDAPLDGLADALPPWLPPAPGPFALGTACLAALVWLAPRGVPGRALAPVLCLPLVCPVLPRLAPGSFEVVVLDVGQGHAALVMTREHTLVYDAGPAWSGGDAGARVVVPALASLGRRPELAVISHADADHAGGLASLRAAHPGIGVAAGEDHARVGPQLPCRRGQAWDWDGVRFEVLHPRRRAHGNAASCVLSVRTPHGGVLLTGDLDAAGERSLLADGARLQHAILLVPHHGSRSSSTAAFVAGVAPDHAIHPAGHGNRWGFPRPEVRARYAEAGVRQWVTGEDGSIQVTVDGQGVRVQAAARAWRGVWRRS